MDQSTAWLLACFALVIASGLYLRRRYGNIYRRFSEALEHLAGFPMATIVRGLGVLTMVIWAVVYLMSGSERETGLEGLFEGLSERSEGAGARP